MLSRTKKAFTLLELIMVIVILGILAALAVPQFGDIKTEAAEGVAYANAKTLVRAAQQAEATDGTQTFEDYVDSIGATMQGFNGEDYGTSVIGTITINGQTVTITNNGNVFNTNETI